MTTDCTPRCRQQGVTLVELLVALMLGLLLTAGMIQVFIGNRATYEFNDSLSRIQENARFTLDHIAYYTRMAGYKGCLSDVAIYNNLDGPDDFRDDIETGIEGFDANNTADGQEFSAGADPMPSANPGAWTPSLPDDLNNLVLPGSDVLVVRSISGAATPLVSPFNTSAQLFADEPNDFVEGEILVVTDCQKASIFQATEVTDNGFGVNLVHSNTGTFIPGNASPTWGPEEDYGLGAEVSRLQAFAFFVGLGENDRPALFQYRLQRLPSGTETDFEAEELAEDIETMQVRYGIDTDNDDAVDSMVSANAVGGDWQRVLSIEVSLLARAAEEYGTEVDTQVYRLGATDFNPVDDRRLRQVFSTSVGVRNRLP